MLNKSKGFPQILTVFDNHSDSSQGYLYSGCIRNALHKILGSEMLFNEFSDECRKKDFLKKFYDQLPVVKWKEQGSAPSCLSIFLLTHFRVHAGKFFYDMISRWLIPGKRLNVALSFVADFKIADFDEKLYTFSEMTIAFEQEHDLEMIRQYLPALMDEIRLGIVSVYHANRILEIKGVSINEKTLLIQERITSLNHRRPAHFDYDIFIQMQHFLVSCRDEFKALRESHHLSRIIYILYFFQKKIRALTELFPQKRHVNFKLRTTRVYFPFGVKSALAVFVGINFLKENEVFDYRHLLNAIQDLISEVVMIEDSYFVNENREERFQTLYMEVAKKDGGDFSSKEIAMLKEALPDRIESQIEHFIRPMFMPRNEEEVMRNILTLSQQLKFVRDLPHVIISFEGQSDSDISFTVIIVRILFPQAAEILEIFEKSRSRFKFVPDRIRKLGIFRKKYIKEAAVFRVKLPNASFLRSDHSVDLYRARQEIVSELQQIFGEVRDYNGGMIAKQTEVFHSLKRLLGKERHNDVLLENFFHSIHPVELRSVIEPKNLEIFFHMLLELIEQRHGPVSSRTEERQIFILIALKDAGLEQEILSAVASLQVSSSQLGILRMQILDTTYLGYIFFCDDQNKRQLFLNTFNLANTVQMK
jgi:hypothetical protein